jgi:hypothetical protein
MNNHSSSQAFLQNQRAASNVDMSLPLLRVWGKVLEAEA